MPICLVSICALSCRMALWFMPICVMPICKEPTCKVPIWHMAICVMPTCKVPTCKVPICMLPSIAAQLCQMEPRTIKIASVQSTFLSHEIRFKRDPKRLLLLKIGKSKDNVGSINSANCTTYYPASMRFHLVFADDLGEYHRTRPDS